jgi:chromosome segregation ATPase
MIKIPTIPFYKIERAVRMLPIVKEVLAPAPTESESHSQITKLKDIIHNKNAEIFKLRQERKSMKRLLFSNNENIKDLEENLENCMYELNILNNAINNTGG